MRFIVAVFDCGCDHEAGPHRPLVVRVTEYEDLLLRLFGIACPEHQCQPKGVNQLLVFDADKEPEIVVGFSLVGTDKGFIDMWAANAASWIKDCERYLNKKPGDLYYSLARASRIWRESGMAAYRSGLKILEEAGWFVNCKS